MAQLTFEFRLQRNLTLQRYEGDLGLRALSVSPEPLWISGVQGSGKTHLLQGLCHQREQEGGRVFYLALDSRDLAPEVLRDLRSFDVLALDGLDHILGEEPWELALYDLINHLAADGATWLVMASQVPLPEAVFALPDVASRCRAMHWLQAGQLSDSEKRRVLMRFADENSLPMPDEVLQFLLDRSPREIGMLINTLTQLADESLRAQRRLTIPFVKEVLRF
ncbi:MAG: HdaA/DnaA family protein [Pseudomonadales bacterium]